MEIQQVKIKDLKNAEYNPRKISDFDLKALKNSIKEFGFVEPVVANKNNQVIGGHQRVKAAQALGIESVPVFYIDLPAEKEKILNLALNRIHGDWDIACEKNDRVAFFNGKVAIILRCNQKKI